MEQEQVPAQVETDRLRGVRARTKGTIVFSVTDLQPRLEVQRVGFILIDRHFKRRVETGRVGPGGDGGGDRRNHGEVEEDEAAHRRLQHLKPLEALEPIARAQKRVRWTQPREGNVVDSTCRAAVP